MAGAAGQGGMSGTAGQAGQSGGGGGTGGACAEATCEAATLVNGQQTPRWLLAEDGWVYWVSSIQGSLHEIRRNPRDKPGKPEPVGEQQVRINHLTRAGAHLYWSAQSDKDPTSDAIFRRPIAGGAREQIAESPAPVQGLAVDEEQVLWASRKVSESFGEVYRKRLSGGEVEGLWNPAESEISTRGAALLGGRAYWLQGDLDGKVKSAAVPEKLGFPKVTFEAEQQAIPLQIFAAEGAIWWLNIGDTGSTQNSIQYKSPGGQIQQVLAQAGNPSSFAVRGGYLVVAAEDQGGPGLRLASTKGPFPVANDAVGQLSTPVNLAADFPAVALSDEGEVYWGTITGEILVAAACACVP